MRTIKVNLKERSYQIIIGSDIINSLPAFIKRLNIGSDAYIITNAPIKSKYGAILNKTLKKNKITAKFRLVSDTEKSKSIKTASSVIKDIAGFDQKRRIFIIALGGGVIGDLAGFIASIYKRGIAYIQIPTTLLAQVDSSIGGKTAVDLIQGKNLLGAFYQPKLVFSDVKLLKSLSLRQVRAGLAEVIKYAIIKDAILFNYLERKYKDILAGDTAGLELIVRRCSSIKARIVSQDEKEERGIRTSLNFGHTIGHAIEAAAGYKTYNHGEAIALGMLVASEMSRKLGLVKEKISQRIENLIKAIGLPTRIEKARFSQIIKAHYRDKKFIGAKNRFVLIKGIGKVKIAENIPLAIIEEAVRERLAI